MSGLVAIQRLAPGVYAVRFRRHGKRQEWLFATIEETIQAAARLLRGEA